MVITPFLLARRLRFPNLIHLSGKTLGEALIGLKKTDQAIQVLEQAVEQAESMRYSRYSVAGREQGRQFYFENKVAAYHLLIDLLVRQDRPLDALLYAEQAKGRVLLDILGNGLSRATLTEKELEEEQRLHQAVVALNNEIRAERLKTTPDVARIATLSSQLNAARMKYESFQNLVSAAHPDQKSLRGRSALLTLDDLSELINDQKTALIEYVVTGERTYLFVLTRRDRDRALELKAYAAAINQSELAARVSRFHRMIGEGVVGMSWAFFAAGCRLPRSDSSVERRWEMVLKGAPRSRSRYWSGR